MTMAPTLVFGLLLCLCDMTLGNYYLKPLSYTKLPATVHPTETYKLFAGTAEEGAYDPVRQMLYVIGEESRLLHILDISDPTNPVQAYTHQFTTSDGIPRDVDICGDEVAVALSSDIRDVYEGHVCFYKAFTKGDTSLVLDGRLPVGCFPDMLTFTPNCSHLLVANEGIPGRDISNTFVDPEGSVGVITRDRVGSPEHKDAGFEQFNFRNDLRIPARFIAPGTTTVAQGLEPEYIAVTADSKYAYVTLQENNAIARLSLAGGIMSEVYPLTPKDWRGIGIDSSNKDGGIHLREYPLVSLQQPDVIKVFGLGGKDYLFTINEGAPTTYTTAVHGFNWADNAKADALMRAKKYDQTALNNATFYADLVLESKTGYLTVSNIDYHNQFTQKMEKVTHFGGRGFSVWNAADMSLVWDSEDEIERHMERLLYNVFNTDIKAATMTYTSPENNRDVRSDHQGPELNAMDLLQTNGIDFLLMGSKPVGALFLYTINTTSGVPIPHFESVHRAGRTDFVWTELYNMNETGDAHISSIGLIAAEDSPNSKPMAYVVGSVSGSVSLYSLEQHANPDNIFG